MKYIRPWVIGVGLMLALDGFRAIAAPLPEPLAVTKIVAQKGDSESASNISQALGFGEVRVETSGTLYSDVTIHLGQDGLSILTSSLESDRSLKTKVY